MLFTHLLMVAHDQGPNVLACYPGPSRSSSILPSGGSHCPKEVARQEWIVVQNWFDELKRLVPTRK